jgi:hypothetical protein
VSRIFGPVAQNGYVVHDIEASMDGWLELGVGPWFYFGSVRMDWFRHRGADSPAEVTIALANSGDLQFELIQQRNDAPSMYREFLDSGREGLQHIAYWTQDYQDLYDRAAELGFTVGHEGCIGGERGRFAYLEHERAPGTVVEISDVSGPKGPFFAHVREVAATWDGDEPVRRLN